MVSMVGVGPGAISAVVGWLVGGLLRYLILCFHILYATLSL